MIVAKKVDNAGAWVCIFCGWSCDKILNHLYRCNKPVWDMVMLANQVEGIRNGRVSVYSQTDERHENQDSLNWWIVEERELTEMERELYEG